MRMGILLDGQISTTYLETINDDLTHVLMPFKKHLEDTIAKWLRAQTAKPERRDLNPGSIIYQSVTLHYLTSVPLFPHL